MALGVRSQLPVSGVAVLRLELALFIDHLSGGRDGIRSVGDFSYSSAAVVVKHFHLFDSILVHAHQLVVGVVMIFPDHSRLPFFHQVPHRVVAPLEESLTQKAFFEAFRQGLEFFQAQCLEFFQRSQGKFEQFLAHLNLSY